MKKGALYTFKAFKGGTLESLREADVKKITRLAGMDAFKAQLKAHRRGPYHDRSAARSRRWHRPRIGGFPELSGARSGHVERRQQLGLLRGPWCVGRLCTRKREGGSTGGHADDARAAPSSELTARSSTAALDGAAATKAGRFQNVAPGKRPTAGRSPSESARSTDRSRRRFGARPSRQDLPPRPDVSFG